MNILGLMSGSSLDGLDLALVKFNWISKPDKLDWKILKSGCVQWSNELVEQLKVAPKKTVQEMPSLDLDYCTENSIRIQKFLSEIATEVDYISSHGHTIYHYPDQQKTLQIGDGHTLSNLTGHSVISDFRTQDLMLGGQGAPLAPIVEKYLFPGFDMYLNLGGIANITISKNWTAFDICPCNQILNHYAQKLNLPYDAEGMLARKGKLQKDLFLALNEWTYYTMNSPKSLDNTQIITHFVPLIDALNLPIQDVLCTFCHHIAHQMKETILCYADKSRSSTIMATGGGVYHSFLLDLIKNNLKDTDVKILLPSDEIIQSKEAILMALMGFLKTEEVPNCLASATGASHDHIAGTIYVI